MNPTQQPRQRKGRNQRHIVRRLIVKGQLVLKSPTSLSSGDTDSPTDIPILRDSISQRALLTGTSIAGALRNYLLEYENNYGARESKTSLSTLLFGAMRQDDDGDQSSLIVYDAISSTVPTLELRDGVKIDSETGTAEDKAKYDLEVLSAGTEFPLQFELLLDQNQDQLLMAIAIALQGLEKGEISLGMKKRRGFGQCKVPEWQVWNFNMRDSTQCRQWLDFDHWTSGFLPTPPEKQSSISQALGVSIDDIDDKRDRVTIKATFNLEGSLLIRSGQASVGRTPDVVHLKSNRNGEPVPVVSGTSLTGALRHRAERIINTLNQSTELIDDLFGIDEQSSQKDAKASRLVVYESVIEKAQDMVQNRIAIDRFTGGAYHGALFDEQPVWGSDETHLTVKLEVRKPQNYDLGLLLLLLKDLWTSDLPIGGESSIGRGRLKGKKATLTWHKPGERQAWKISQLDQGNLQVQNLEIQNQPEQAVKKELQNFVDSLVHYIKLEAENTLQDNGSNEDGTN